MGKTDNATPPDQQAAEPVPVTPVTFLDKQYKARTLILPDRRVMSVQQMKVTVASDDAAAIDFFRKRSDFERVQE
ncbi:MAG: hypothetical protein ACLGJA_10955 [Gammaproteobacteria bacterium]